MLHKLSLYDYALVDKVELELGEGLNVITGETGAGKSILVGAIATLLGEKAGFNVTRDDDKKAVLEGLFVNCINPALERLLQENGIDLDAGKTLLIRREFHPTGRSRAFVNDSPVPAAVLENLSAMLADLHGQHEHQSLLRPRTHLNYLDTFAGLEGLRTAVEAAFDEVQKLRMHRADLLDRQNEIRARRDLEAFQLQEIRAVDPQPGEEEALMEELKLLGNAERRSELAGRIIDLLTENQHAIQSQLRATLEALEELNRLDARFQSLHEECRSAEAVLLEAAHELGSYQNQIELDAGRLEHVRERLAELQRLKKKYGGAMAEVFARLEKLAASRSAFENFDSALAEFNRQVAEAEAACARLALELSGKRKAAARQLGKTVPEVLAELGLPGTRFEVRMSVQPEEDGFIVFDGARIRAGRNGIDQIEFYISTNVGHEVSPLAKVASGGEISRIMLALKSIIAERDEIPVLIFDEIDSGVSGRVAQVVGRRLQKLAESHQIICITHLPQIASAGRHHFLVEKKTARGRARTVVRRLNPSERTAAIASLLGGEKLTEAHTKSAQELLAEAGNEVT